MIPLGVLASARVAAGGAWTPASVAGTAMWFDATDGATITHSGGLVSKWSDKGSLGYHLTNTTESEKPTTGATSQNGLNVISFGGAQSLLNFDTTSTMFLHDGTKHIIGVVAYKNTTANKGLFSTRQDGGGAVNGAWLYLPSTTLWHIITVRTGTTKIPANNQAAGVISSTNPFVTTVAVDSTNATAAERSAIYVGSGGAIKNNTSLESGTVVNSKPFVLGSLTTPPGTYNLTGWIGELVIIAGTDATESNRAALHTYLKTKWSIA